MGLAAFNRMRRLRAQKEAEECAERETKTRWKKGHEAERKPKTKRKTAKTKK